MKFSKRILLLTLVTSLFLVGCGDEGGFSISKTDDQSTALQQTSTMGDDMKEEEQESVSAISSSGTTNGEPEEVPHTDKEPTTSAPSTEAATPAVDLGNQITTFVFTFVNSNEEMYANVSFEDDPFDSKYDFAYYTVNDQKLEKSDFHEKQTVDGVETYKIYFGSNESGTYVLKFYNSSEKQSDYFPHSLSFVVSFSKKLFTITLSCESCSASSEGELKNLISRMCFKNSTFIILSYKSPSKSKRWTSRVGCCRLNVGCEPRFAMARYLLPFTVARNA